MDPSDENSKTASEDQVKNDDLLQDKVGEGLTDDERVSREDEFQGDGSRVTPGPADEDRLPKS